ncbi:outer membrane protein [Swaminathania salitolerans LMG 21291]|nr:outer membrane protein [Swaminathania salitolerans LMG 21291]
MVGTEGVALSSGERVSAPENVSGNVSGSVSGSASGSASGGVPGRDTDADIDTRVSAYAGAGTRPYSGPVILTGDCSAVMRDGQLRYLQDGQLYDPPVSFGSGASLLVTSGVTLSAIDALPDSYLHVSIASGGRVSGATLEETDMRVSVLSGGVTEGNRFTGSVDFEEGAVSRDDTFMRSEGGYGYASVMSGAVVSNLTMEETTSLHCAGGSVIDGLTLSSGAAGYIDRGVALDAVMIRAGADFTTHSPLNEAFGIPARPASGPNMVAGNVWRAEPGPDGKTRYVAEDRGEGEEIFTGVPVFPPGGSLLYVTSGAVVSGLVGDDVYIHVQDGGILTGCYIASGGLTVQDGGVSRGNVLRACPTLIEPGGVSEDDLWEGSESPFMVMIQKGARVDRPGFGNYVMVEAYRGCAITAPRVAEGGSLYIMGASTDACFLPGTLIRCEIGDMPVERVARGDRVWCLEGGREVLRRVTRVVQRPRTVAPTLSDDCAGYAVRILAGAFGDSIPQSDLCVTSEHCFLFEGRFIPIRMLVNGRSIAYDRARVSYVHHHIELERHAVIFANGAPTESYLDTASRRLLPGAGNVIALSPCVPRSWERDSAAPLCVLRDFVEPVYRRLADIADRMGLPVAEALPECDSDPALSLVDDRGRQLPVLRRSGDRITFSVPRRARHVRLRSRTSRPFDTIGPFVDDRRALGVLVGEIRQFGSRRDYLLTTHLTGEALAGWHDPEHASCRWTAGDALIVLTDDPQEMETLLTIEILAGGPYVVASRSAAPLAVLPAALRVTSTAAA